MQISVQDLPVSKFGVSTIANYYNINFYYCEFIQSVCKIYIKLLIKLKHSHAVINFSKFYCVTPGILSKHSRMYIYVAPSPGSSSLSSCMRAIISSKNA